MDGRRLYHVRQAFGELSYWFDLLILAKILIHGIGLLETTVV